MLQAGLLIGSLLTREREPVPGAIGPINIIREVPPDTEVRFGMSTGHPVKARCAADGQSGELVQELGGSNVLISPVRRGGQQRASYQAFGFLPQDDKLLPEGQTKVQTLWDICTPRDIEARLEFI